MITRHGRGSALVALVAVVALVAPVASAQTPSAPPAAANDSDELTRLARARSQLDAGDLATAEPVLRALSDSASPRVAGQAWFSRGVLEEKRFAFAVAVDAYAQSIARDPGGRYAARAAARVDSLRARSEGDYVPLTALERVRSSPTLSSDATAIAALARDADHFPPGPVRGEARLLAAQAYMGRLHRPGDAPPVLRAIALDTSASPDLRRIAVDLLTRVREERGEFAIALTELNEIHAPEANIVRIRRQVRRAVLFRIAWGSIALVLAAGVLAIARLARTKRMRELLTAWKRPLPLAHLAMLSLGGAYLAHSYEDHDVRPFYAFGVGALAVYLAASAWSLAGSRHAVLRVARALACAIAVLAVSFLAMHRFDAGMLEGINL